MMIYLSLWGPLRSEPAKTEADTLELVQAIALSQRRRSFSSGCYGSALIGAPGVTV
jgi:hypothetical protein